MAMFLVGPKTIRYLKFGKNNYIVELEWLGIYYQYKKRSHQSVLLMVQLATPQENMHVC